MIVAATRGQELERCPSRQDALPTAYLKFLRARRIRSKWQKLARRCQLFLESSGPSFEEQSSMKIVHQGPAFVTETDRITSEEVVGESAQCQADNIAAAVSSSLHVSSTVSSSYVLGNFNTAAHDSTDDGEIVTEGNLGKLFSYVPLVRDVLLCEKPVLDNLRTVQDTMRSCNLVLHNHEEAHDWVSLPEDIRSAVLNKLNYEDLCQVKAVSTGMKKTIESQEFLSYRGGVVSTEGTLTALHFCTKDGVLQMSGFDVNLNKWRTLPPCRGLPSPDLFKEYLVSGCGGLLCANVSKFSGCEQLVVGNPLTQTYRVLPPLNFRRNPVLLHMLVNRENNSYKVLVAGSSGMTAEHTLSRTTEVFDSVTSKWEVTGDLPTFEYGLNEYQTGVCINGLLYCIAFLGDGSGKGVLAYNVEKGKWLASWRCPLPLQQDANFYSIAQLVECDGELYLFLERELPGQAVEHRIYKLENALDLVAADQRAIQMGRWREVVRETKFGSRGLRVYPEYTCVSFGDVKLCIFNTIELEGRVYDIRNGDSRPEPLPSFCKETKVHHCLNPLSFTFEPRFNINPCHIYTVSVSDYEGCTSSDSEVDPVLLERWSFDPQLLANTEATELSVESDDLEVLPPIL